MKYIGALCSAYLVIYYLAISIAGFRCCILNYPNTIGPWKLIGMLWRGEIKP